MLIITIKNKKAYELKMRGFPHPLFIDEVNTVKGLLCMLFYVYRNINIDVSHIYSRLIGNHILHSILQLAFLFNSIK